MLKYYQRVSAWRRTSTRFSASVASRKEADRAAPRSCAGSGARSWEDQSVQSVAAALVWRREIITKGTTFYSNNSVLAVIMARQTEFTNLILMLIL